MSAFGYDAVGRPSTVGLNGNSPHVRYEYHWSPPLPRTTTWVFDGRGRFRVRGANVAVGPHWRSTTSVANGAGEPLFATTPLGSQFIVSGWKERDERGQVVRSAEPFYAPTAAAGRTAPRTRAS